MRQTSNEPQPDSLPPADRSPRLANSDPSLLHGPDPRLMLLLAIGFMIGVVATPGVEAKGVYAAGVSIIFLALGLGMRRYLLVLAPLTLFFVMTFLLRAVVQAKQYDDAIFIDAIPFSVSGLLLAVSLSLQVITIALALSSAILSNPPLALSESLEVLLKPLSRLGLPVHEAALMFSIALRFIPVMVDEFRRLTTAQAMRGAALTSRGPLSRVQSIIPLVIPLFMVTLIRAHEQSEAIESRGYDGAEGRTLIRTYRFTSRDAWLAGFAFAICTLSIVVSCI